MWLGRCVDWPCWQTCAYYRWQRFLHFSTVPLVARLKYVTESTAITHAQTFEFPQACSGTGISLEMTIALRHVHGNAPRAMPLQGLTDQRWYKFALVLGIRSIFSKGANEKACPFHDPGQPAQLTWLQTLAIDD
jgi:hypothetical protein